MGAAHPWERRPGENGRLWGGSLVEGFQRREDKGAGCRCKRNERQAETGGSATAEWGGIRDGDWLFIFSCVLGARPSGPPGIAAAPGGDYGGAGRGGITGADDGARTNAGDRGAAPCRAF